MSKRQKPTLIRALMADAQGNIIGEQTVRRDQTRQRYVRRSSLTAEQKVRAEKLYKRLRTFQRLGVICGSIGAWYDGFEMDMHPNRELAAWEQIATVFEKLKDHPAAAGYTTWQVAQAIIGTSMGVVDVPSQQGVTDEFVALIRALCPPADLGE